eukprot:5029285-Alexandrium_andersonii.AAC.1
MSASLVGSEMCIRDRSTGGLGPEKATGVNRPRPDRSRSGFARRRASKPVSYTHLTLPTICSV